MLLFYFFIHRDKPVRVYPIQLAQGRRQVLAQSFSILQAEVEEAIGELESVRLLYADGDLRPSKDNRNNVATSLQDKDSNFSGEKLLFILHTLKIYLYTPRVCSAAVRALWALTYNEEVRQDLITPVVIDLLLKVTKLHISDPAICLYATGVYQLKSFIRTSTIPDPDEDDRGSTIEDVSFCVGGCTCSFVGS